VTNASELAMAAHSNIVSGPEPDADELSETMIIPLAWCVLGAAQDIKVLNTIDQKTTAG
jgi:hypothetical protein